MENVVPEPDGGSDKAVLIIMGEGEYNNGKYDYFWDYCCFISSWSVFQH